MKRKKENLKVLQAFLPDRKAATPALVLSRALTTL